MRPIAACASNACMTDVQGQGQYITGYAEVRGVVQHECEDVVERAM